MGSGSVVSHEGIIEKISDGMISVRFVSHSACSACHAKGVCDISGSEVKFVEIKNVGAGYEPGDRVVVLLEQKQGFVALAYGYLYPLIVLLIVLFSLSAITGREGLSALIALASLIPYYFLIWLIRRRISGKFEFTVHKTE